MGENAALETENSEPSPLPEEEIANNPQNELDEAIQQLSATSAAAKGLSKSASSSADTSAPIWDIPVDVNVIMGSVELTVARLMELENDDVLELDRHVGEPLDIAVNGQNIAKGKIVMNENDKSQFAIQITELVGR